MSADRSAADLERFLAERGDHLLRAAVLLTSRREAGAGLLPMAVNRLLRRWRAQRDPGAICAGDSCMTPGNTR